MINKSIPVQVNNLCGVVVAGIEENTLENNISVYPNPCYEQLYIEITNYKNTIAEIFDLQGQLLQSIPLQSYKTIIQINHINSGIYFVKVKSPEGMIIEKFVKN